MTPATDHQGIDAAWIAVDALGHVAIFTTGGEGVIPATAFAYVGTVENGARSLPRICDCELLTTVARPDDFVAFAERGLFAYDWSDVHRPASQASGGYALQARPSRPLLLADLSESLQVAAKATRVSGITFGGSIVVTSELV